MSHNFIQKAIGQNKGLLHSKAKAADELTKRNTIKIAWLRDMEHSPDKTLAKEARLALTLRELRKRKKTRK